MSCPGVLRAAHKNRTLPTIDDSVDPLVWAMTTNPGCPFRPLGKRSGIILPNARDHAGPLARSVSDRMHLLFQPDVAEQEQPLL